jgi:TolA-binding protein
MSWLQARLAFDRGEPARSLELVTSLRGGLAELDAELRAEVASSLALLEAQANFALGRPDAALAVLQQLRADYPQADAAVFSYVVEAEAYVAQGRLVDAQRVFVKLADDFPGNRFAPYGLLQAALTVRRLGQDSNRREAYNILERLVQNYPGSDLIFAARFAQGDLLRELNQFANALQIYERLVIDFPRHGDVRAAELAVADCQAALAATDPARLENAIAGYERLQFLPTAAPDLRMEAGFKHGYALARSGKRARAQEVWWPLAEPFTAGEATSPRLGTGGRYWLARVLLELGLLHEREARFEQARDMFGLILRLGLPRGDEARGALARLGAGGVTP